MTKSKTPLKNGAEFFVTRCGFVGVYEEDWSAHHSLCVICAEYQKKLLDITK